MKTSLCSLMSLCKHQGYLSEIKLYFRLLLWERTELRCSRALRIVQREAQHQSCSLLHLPQFGVGHSALNLSLMHCIKSR